VRETAVQRLQQGGWTAASPLPRSLLERWWQLAREQQPSGEPLPAAIDAEAEKAVCGAMVAEWVQLLVSAMCTVARKCGSPLLSLGMLESATLSDWSLPKEAQQGSVAQLYERLHCTVTLELDAMQLPEPVQSTPVAQVAFLKLEDFPAALPSEFSFSVQSAAAPEEMATLRILDGDSWYHQPDLARRVAEQFISGQRCSHTSDTLLSEMGIRPMRVQGLLPPRLLSCYGFSLQDLERKVTRLHLVATDAAGRDWPLVLKDDGQHGELTEPERPGDTTLATISFFADGTPWVDGSHTAQRCSVPGIWGEFELRLSHTQQRVVEHLQQVIELSNAHWTEAAQESCATQRLNSPAACPIPCPAPADAAPCATAQPGAQVQRHFGTVQLALSAGHRRQKLFKGFRLATTMLEWRAHQFEQIALQAHPLLDYNRWGMSRYAEMHTAELRCRFQAFLIDAAMQANGMQQLPAALVDIIAEYYCLDTLPYVSPEEQRTLSANA
jgi:hypothetical protein